jgi:hypothetical protein
MYIEGLRVSAQATKETTHSGSGFEGSYSGKDYGVAAGSWNAGCSGCISQTAILLGGSFKYLNAGLRYQKVDQTPTYGLGLLVNATGTHRLGVRVENENPDVSASSVMKTGVGYSYSNNDDTITIDAVQRKDPTTSSAMNVIGYKKKVSFLEVTMTYEMDTTNSVDRFWMGAGFKGRTFHLSIYSKYNTQLMRYSRPSSNVVLWQSGRAAHLLVNSCQILRIVVDFHHW